MSTLALAKRTDIFRWSIITVLGSLVLAVSAQIQIPFYPIPVTLQDMTVILLAVAFGWRISALTVLLYLAEGFVGLPVFAEFKAGPMVLFGTTGGYLLGFLAASFIVGYLSQRNWSNKIFTTLLMVIAGNAVIFILGVSWLSALVGWQEAFLVGFAPFIVGNVCKIIFATTVAYTGKSLLKQFKG